MAKALSMRGIASVMVALLLCVLACQRPPSTTAETARPAAASTTSEKPRHDLSQDETEGGHTLQRHIGRSDQELAERLHRERHISAASTYTDRATAETAVAVALEQDQERIQRWLNRTGGHPNLVLDYHGDQPIGVVLHRGESHSVPCPDAVVVLKWNGPGQYYILTSYPECR